MRLSAIREYFSIHDDCPSRFPKQFAIVETNPRVGGRDHRRVGVTGLAVCARPYMEQPVQGVTPLVNITITAG